MAKFRAAYQKKQDLDPPTLHNSKTKLAIAASQRSPEAVLLRRLVLLQRRIKTSFERDSVYLARLPARLQMPNDWAHSEQAARALDKLRSLRVRIQQSEASNEYKKSMLTPMIK